MPIVKDITKTQFFKVYEMLNDVQTSLTVDEIHEMTGFPRQSIRRIISDLRKADKIITTREISYRLK